MKRTGKRFRPGAADSQYDVIVIGSGIGSLVSAALLALRNRRVCVLEQHYTTGGLTQTFERAGYEWDIGINATGGVLRSSDQLRRLFDTVSSGRLQWTSLPNSDDQIHINDQRYTLPPGREALRAALKGYFPLEHKAIDRYIAMVDDLGGRTRQLYAWQALRRPLATVAELWRRIGLPAFAWKTTAEVMSSLTGNQMLVSLLTSRWGNYGLPPAQSAFLMHALAVSHFFTGRAYPAGGGWAIADSIIPTIEAAGGDVFTYAKVSAITMNGNKAVGVVVNSSEHIRAPVIISGAGLLPTLQLLPRSEFLQRSLFSRLGHLRLSTGHLALFLGLKGDAQALALDQQTYWLSPGPRHDDSFTAFDKDPGAPLPLTYITFPSSRESTWAERYPGRSTAQVLVPARCEWFDNWADTSWNRRGDGYDQLKSVFTDRLLSQLLKIRPDLENALDFSELSTPLSTRHFLNNIQGEMFGLAHTPERFRESVLHPQTPVANLYLTGSDVVSAGLGGAARAGMLTASVVLGFEALANLSIMRF
ncbi:NAD(P)/FAD-dependent oxidoreductase [Allohahella marinimesophila]|uniref:NAD(P)/FAD-dependent oxidoreductase n=1 Tax=Allohahella marinimesophila TaxID=1054972 RepID=A0ABP7P3Q5_9GAMM